MLGPAAAERAFGGSLRQLAAEEHQHSSLGKTPRRRRRPFSLPGRADVLRPPAHDFRVRQIPAAIASNGSKSRMESSGCPRRRWRTTKGGTQRQRLAAQELYMHSPENVVEASFIP
jgi:hypothetical protein